MYEIRIHGRGGQGVRMTAHILGRAGFLSGLKTQDFAIYGAERRGAPVASFCRLDRKEIDRRGYVFGPDAVIVLDPSLDMGMCTRGLKEKGILLVNSKKGRVLPEGGFRIRFIDATNIALKAIGKPIPNAAILGGFAKVSGILSLDCLKKAIGIELGEAGHPEDIAGNIKACEICYDKVV